MKTILSRMKTLVNDNKTGTLSYVRLVEVIHPDLAQSVIIHQNLPGILLFPISTREDWQASQQKIAFHEVGAYLVISHYMQRENSIMGDSTRNSPQGIGILDFVEDFLEVFRGHRLALNDQIYLDKPLEVTNIQYMPAQVSDNVFILAAAITMSCTNLFLQTSLPGNV